MGGCCSADVETPQLSVAARRSQCRVDVIAACIDTPLRISAYVPYLCVALAARGPGFAAFLNMPVPRLYSCCSLSIERSHSSSELDLRIVVLSQVVPRRVLYETCTCVVHRHEDKDEISLQVGPMSKCKARPTVFGHPINLRLGVIGRLSGSSTSWSVRPRTVQPRIWS